MTRYSDPPTAAEQEDLARDAGAGDGGDPALDGAGELLDAEDWNALGRFSRDIRRAAGGAKLSILRQALALIESLAGALEASEEKARLLKRELERAKAEAGGHKAELAAIANALKLDEADEAERARCDVPWSVRLVAERFATSAADDRHLLESVRRDSDRFLRALIEAKRQLCGVLTQIPLGESLGSFIRGIEGDITKAVGGESAPAPNRGDTRLETHDGSDKP